MVLRIARDHRAVAVKHHVVDVVGPARGDGEKGGGVMVVVVAAEMGHGVCWGRGALREDCGKTSGSKRTLSTLSATAYPLGRDAKTFARIARGGPSEVARRGKAVGTGAGDPGLCVHARGE